MSVPRISNNSFLGFGSTLFCFLRTSWFLDFNCDGHYDGALSAIGAREDWGDHTRSTIDPPCDESGRPAVSCEFFLGLRAGVRKFLGVAVGFLLIFLGLFAGVAFFFKINLWVF